MSYPADYTGICPFEHEAELHSPRPRLVRGDYALVPMTHSHRPDRPLAQYIADDSLFDSACTLRHRSVPEAAIIDREGPYGYRSSYPHYSSFPQSYDDADYFDLPDPNWRFSHTYPLPSMEGGRVRWDPDQIRAYNRDVLRHNNQIARRKAVGAPGEFMMLHPTMDLQGRFPPGFDGPMRIEEFFGLDEPLIDSHRDHYHLPPTDHISRLLLLNANEHHLRRQLKQVQLLEYYGARRLAEQFSIQLLGAQHALPGLAVPRLGYGLGPDFDDSYLSPLTRDVGGRMPLQALGYGSGLANWNQETLQQMVGAGAGGAGQSPSWARAGLLPRLGMGMGMGMGVGMGTGMNRGPGFSAGGWPGMSYSGVGVCGGGGGWGGPGGIERVVNRISFDGGGGGGGHSRSRRFG